VDEAVLRDGDAVELGNGGPRLRVAIAFPWAVPERRSALARALDAVAGAARRVEAHTSSPFRRALVLAACAGAALLAFNLWQNRRLQRDVGRLQDALAVAEGERRRFTERVEEERRREERERAGLEQQAQALRRRAEELQAQLDAAATGELPALRSALADARSRLDSLETDRATAERIIREYGPGVALIQGAYAFYGAEARPLRHVLDEAGRRRKDEEGEPLLDPEGQGPIYTSEFVGTGFLVDARGLLLTNRHVAQPWWNDDRTAALSARGFEPRFTVFRAFLPRVAEPFELELERHAEKVDLAVVRFDPRGLKLPVLPLDRSGRGAVAGHPVVVVGYPAGLEALLAKADTGVVKDIVDAAGSSTERMTEGIARRGLVRPSATQGHIGDVTSTDVVFDAPTTQGGSGGPVFNRDGKVIAVEYAVLSKFGGNSFGVPVAEALKLLRPARPGRTR
jgi:S1-C subfamily serine protease